MVGSPKVCLRNILLKNFSLYIPTAKLNFSEVWSTSQAITSVLRVSLHPCFTPIKYYFLSETKSFKDITLRVAPESPEIRLVDHSLYRHEYISCPPLQDLRVIFLDDEGPRNDADGSDLSFLVRLSDSFAETYLTQPSLADTCANRGNFRPFL